MYTSGINPSLLSLGNIHKFAKGGMVKNKKNTTRGGESFFDKIKNTILNTGAAPTTSNTVSAQAPAAPVAAPAPPAAPAAPPAPAPPAAPAAAPDKSTGVQPPTGIQDKPAVVSTESGTAPVPKSTTETEITTSEEKESSNITKIFLQIYDDLINQAEQIKLNTQTKNIYTILFVLIILSIVIAIINTVLYFIKRNKEYKIIMDERYNKDLTEYNMAKKPHMFRNLELLPYTVLGIIMPWLLLIPVIIISISFILSNNFITILLFVSIITIFIIILILAYFVNYIKIIKDLKRVRKRIDVFENFVYSKFYINGPFLQTLYNKGVDTDNPNAIIRKAIKNTLLANEEEKPSIDTITKIAYTLNLYYFLNKDLVNDEILKRYYRTECLEVFNPSIVMLPGKSRIFRIGDYMRSNIPANMNDMTSISNILSAMNVILKIDSDTLTRIKIQIKNDMYTTRSLAFQIGAYKMDKPILILVLISVIMYIVLAVFIGFLMYKATKKATTESQIEVLQQE